MSGSGSSRRDRLGITTQVRRILLVGMVAVLATVGLSPTHAQAAVKAGCRTTVATFTLTRGHVPVDLFEHRITARECWNSKGKLTSTSVGSDVNTLWVAKTFGLEASGSAPIKRSNTVGGTYNSWAVDGRARQCVSRKIVTICTPTILTWRFNVNFYGPAYKGTVVSPGQAAAFMFETGTALSAAQVKVSNY